MLILYLLDISATARLAANLPYPGSEFVVRVPYGAEPAYVCRMKGYQPARGNPDNRKRLAKLLRRNRVSEAYVGSYPGYPNGVLLTSRGRVRPYNIYRDTAEYTICSYYGSGPYYGNNVSGTYTDRSLYRNRDAGSLYSSNSTFETESTISESSQYIRPSFQLKEKGGTPKNDIKHIKIKVVPIVKQKKSDKDK